MAIQLQLRRGTTAEWTAGNPILAEGELALDLTIMRIKIGDGVNHWLDLDYVDGTGLTQPQIMARSLGC